MVDKPPSLLASQPPKSRTPLGGLEAGRLTKPAPATIARMLARIGMRIADFCERWFPDAFVFALAAIVLVFLGGLGIGVPATTLVAEFGTGFWSLVNFTMQMAIVIIGGFVVASSPPVARLTSRLASIPKTARGAVAFVAAFAMLSSLISWGLSLIFTGLLVRDLTRRAERG